MKKTKNGFKLSTGKMIYPDLAPWGIGNPGAMGFIIVEYEGAYIYVTSEGHGGSPDLTKEEAREVALFMSNHWQIFADSLK